MPDFGFPAQYRQNNMARLIADLRSRSDDSRVEAVTGRFADVTSERSGRVSELMQLEKSISDLQVYAEAIALSETRSDTMQQSLGAIVDTAQILTDATAVLGTTGTDTNFATLSGQAAEGLETIVNALNVNFAGRSLFGGDEGSNPPLVDANTIFATSTTILVGGGAAGAAYAALQTEFLNPGATFDTTFYQGGAGRAPLTEVAPGEQVDYTVKADDSAARNVLFNTTVLAAAFDLTNAIPQTERRELMRLASDGLRTAIGELTTLRSDLGTAEARIASVKARNIATEATLTLRFNDLAAADQFDAALSLNELDSQLETAFATTARLSNISLSNFI